MKRVTIRDWRVLANTLAACSIASIIATFQFAVYTSFLSAGAVVPHILNADLWVSAAGVECFDFPDTINEDYAGIVQRLGPDVRVRRVVVGFVPWRSPSGGRGNVSIVGVDGLSVTPQGFLADRSDLARLGIGNRSPDRSVQATIGDTTLSYSGSRDDLSSFLGAPYILANLETARSVLRMDPASVAYLAVDLPEGRPPPDLKAFSRQFPEISVRTAASFERSSSQYWQSKTGAGLAILLAALLAAILMILLLTNGILRFIQQYHRDLISLIGHGAGKADITAIVALVAAGIAFFTVASAALLGPLLVQGSVGFLPWVRFETYNLAAPTIGAIFSFVIAMFGARQAISSYGPDVVFRA